MIKAIAFDNDCVISKYDMLEFVSREIGKAREGKFWEDEYHKGLSSAKNEGEREAVAERALKGKYSVVEGMDLKELKSICARIESTNGAKECLDKLHNKGIKIIVISATLLPIARFFAETHGLPVDEFIASECETNGSLGKVHFVLTPVKKGEKLKEFLDKSNISPEECIAVGDSTSELSMFKMVGKEMSIGFNCRDSLRSYVGHIASHFGDEKRDLSSVLKIVDGF